MKVVKSSLSFVLLLLLSAGNIYAACPLKESGEIDYGSIKTAIRDLKSDVTPDKYFYNDVEGTWGREKSADAARSDPSRWLDIKSLGFCLDLFFLNQRIRI